MTTSTRLEREQMELLQPDDDVFLEREGWDRSGIRREIAPLNTIDSGTRVVRKNNSTLANPNSDRPFGATGIGEAHGDVDVVVDVGEPVELYRYSHGLSHFLEDEEVDMAQLQEKRNLIMELFDIEFDIQFLFGIEDRGSGNTLRQGVLDWLKDEIPAENTIDASTYDVEEDLNGVKSNIIKREAYAHVDGQYVDTQWMTMIGRHKARAAMNELDTNEGAVRDSTWDVIAGGDDADTVGMQDFTRIPEFIGLGNFGDFEDDKSLVKEVTDDDWDADDVVLLPDHGGDFFSVYEQPSPDVREPITEKGWRERVEYKSWFGHTFNNSRLTRGVPRDAVYIENFTSLFNMD